MNKLISFLNNFNGKNFINRWATRNLDVVSFNNGDLIPEAQLHIEWEKAAKEKKPVWCYFASDPSNGPKYGKMYNWYAVNDKRGLAPKGWHIPSY